MLFLRIPKCSVPKEYRGLVSCYLATVYNRLFWTNRILRRKFWLLTPRVSGCEIRLYQAHGSIRWLGRR